MKSRVNRQKIRRAMILISFILFPLTLYYLSPYVIIVGIAEGVMTGSFIVFLMMLVGSILFGRLFCGWICPAGGLQDACALVNDKRNKGKWRKWIKYMIWVPWLSVIVMLGVHAGGITNVDFFYMTEHGVSVARPEGYIIYYFVLFLIFIVTIIGGRRSFCHSFCWMAPFMQIGMTIRKVLHIPGLHLETNPEKCIGCGQCTKRCIMSLEVAELVKEGSIKNVDCSLCGECADTCPKKVIHFSMGK